MQSKLDQAVYHQFYDCLNGGVCIIRASGKDGCMDSSPVPCTAGRSEDCCADTQVECQTEGREEILFVNRQVPELYGCKNEEEFYEMTGGTFSGMTQDSDRRPLSMHVAKGAAHSYWYYDIPLRNGSVHPAEMVISRDVREGIPVYICQIFTEDMQAESFRSDGLTGLPGVYDFTERSFALLKEYRDKKELDQWAFVYFNIVNFRSFNSALGVVSGDRLIKKTAEILQDAFPGCFLGHLSADHFAAIVPRQLCESSVRETVRDVNEIIRHKSVQFKAGIFFPENEDDDKTLRSALDYARIACDSIAEDATRSAAIYSSKMQAGTEKKSYILNHFDSALENGYIRVYYQPVVRTLTQKLCGFEALARWEDPEIGMISPADFVPLLESVRLIGRLDTYVVKNVCRFLSERRDNGYEILPVSVNFSRLDFDLINPIDLLTQTLDQYSLPHFCIHAEITESVMVWDKERLIETIRKFHEAGFEVWLDDFGSDYSSLKTLHYFPFDVLKIDLEFFRNFDERGRKIIMSVVMMAKSLGMYTVAEGVETGQQFEFLRSIDCGMIQGWYYGKPMPFEVVMEQMTRRGIGQETSFERAIFRKVGLVNTVTDRPVAIFRFDGKAPELLMANEAYMNVLRSTGTADFDTANKNLRSGLFAVQKKICAFLEKVAAGKAHSMTYIDNGQYILARAEKISGTDEMWYGTASISNISIDENVRQTKQLDGIFRNMELIFDGIYYLNMGQDEVNVIESIHSWASSDTNIPGVDRTLRKFARDNIYIDDRSRFLKFVDKNHLYEMAEKSGRSEATDLFRVHWDDGSYHWSVFHAIVLLKSASRDVILLEREDVWERKEERARLLPEFVSSFPEVTVSPKIETTPEENGDAARFRALLESRNFRFFWTDREGRVLGISEAFSRFSGLALSDVQGKTEKNVHFFINIPELVQYEKKLMDSGTEVQTDASVIHNGIVQDMTLTGIPFYEGKEAAGALVLLEEKNRGQGIGLFLDRSTGFLDYYGILAAAGRFDDAYRDSYAGYCVMELALADFREYSRQFGNKATRILTRVIAETLHQADLRGVAVGRAEGCTFLFVTAIANVSKLAAAAELCRKAVEDRANVDGLPIHPRIGNGIAYGEEATGSFGALRLAHDRRIAREKIGALLLDPDRQFIIDIGVFDDMPEWVTLIDAETYDVLYANRAVRNDFHIDAGEDLGGRKCYELFNGSEGPCSFCSNARLRRDAVYCWNRRYQSNGKLILNRDFLIPYKGRMAVMSIGIPLSSYMNLNAADHELLKQETNANDTIERGIAQDTPEKAIQVMLREIGQNLGSQRVLIFEQQEGAEAVSCTYEWHQQGLMPVMPGLKAIPKRHLSPLYRQLDDRQVVLIEDYKTFEAEHPDMQLPISGIDNIISGKIQLAGGFYGFTMVINSSSETFRQASLLLWTLTDVLAIVLRACLLRNKLLKQELLDTLTGVGSRQGLWQYVGNLKTEGRVVFIGGKVGGLKGINLSGGQGAGDRLLKRAADVLAGLSSRNRVFRTGGGEFVIVEEQMDEEGAGMLIQRICEENRSQDIRMTFGLAVMDGNSLDFDEIMRRIEVSLEENQKRSLPGKAEPSAQDGGEEKPI